MAERTYRVKIVRADQQFEAEGDRAFVLQMLQRLEGGGKVRLPLSKTEQGKGAGTEDKVRLISEKGISPGEFIRQFPFKKHTDFVLAFGYYLEKHSDLADFTAADINNCYYEAKMESSNTSQMIIQNIKRGFMMQAKNSGKSAKGPKRYTLTQTGEQYLQKAIAKTQEQ
jgi:hypothetical protein